MEIFSKDKRTNRILKRFQKGDITLREANSLILQNDKVIDLALMYKIFQTIIPTKKDKSMTSKDKAIAGIKEMTAKEKYDYLIGMIESCMEKDDDIVITEKLLDSLIKELSITLK